MMNDKVSVVTAVYNGEMTLSRLIDSIISQGDDRLEFIIIDGNSTDGTNKIIEKYQSSIDFSLSERDNGIYDAWNKGIERATGDWIMFLGCDDLLKPNAMKRYRQFMDTIPDLNKVDLISSRVEMIDEKGTIIRIKGWAWEWPKFLREMTIAHPGALHSRRLFQKYGPFNTEFKIVGDFEFLIRNKGSMNAQFMNEVTVTMSEGGASDSMRAIIEHYLAATKTGGYPKLMALLNCSIVMTKFCLKKLARRMGFNMYLNR